MALVVKEYHNCRPVSEEEPTFYDGVSFDFFNGSSSVVYVALEANTEIELLNGFPSGLQPNKQAGTYDPKTVRKVRPNERVTLWDKSKGCGLDNMKCDGTEGREILIVDNEINSIPKRYTWEDYGYNPPVCCVDVEIPECVECCCDKGEVVTQECVACNPNPCAD